MWNHFDGTARSGPESAAHLATLKWTDWKPEGITLHNTAAPTLKQWAESGPNHDARIRNLQNYYENELGWHAGPHWFISRTAINWFSDPLRPGVHSRCWNATRFGIEMVGDYNAEEFDSGDGAMVRDLAIYWIAVLNLRFGFKAEDIKFHVECEQDNHDCPGHKVVKGAVIARVKKKMAELKGSGPVVEPPPVEPPPPQGRQTLRRGSTGPDVEYLQTLLGVKVDSDFGPVTENAVKALQKDRGLAVDGVVGTATWLELAKGGAIVKPAKPGEWQTNITASVFGGSAEDERSAYDGHRITDTEFSVALPYVFAGARPKVEVRANGKSHIADISDVGPWVTDNPFWQTGSRPLAEAPGPLKRGPNKGRTTNKAGIDLSPALARYLGIDGLGRVDFRLVK